MIKAFGEALSDVFKIDFKSANDGLKNASFHCIKTDVAKMAQNRILDDLFDFIVENWTQSALFIDEFSRHALTASGFDSPMARFIHKV